MFVSDKNSMIIKTGYSNKNCDTLLHEDNFHLFNLLLPEKLLECCSYHSSIENKPQLIIEVLNKFKYTTELAFYYAFDFGKSEKIVMKIYHDAQLAEVVYCTDLQKFIRLMGPKICPKIHKQTRSMLNTFLSKWLLFLLNNGYRKDYWKPKNKKL